MNNIRKKIIALILFAFGLVTTKAQILVDQNVLKNNLLRQKTIYYEVKSLSEEQLVNIKDQREINNLQIQYQEENDILKKTLESQWLMCEKLIGITKEEIETRLNNNQETWYLTLNRHTDKFLKKKVYTHKDYYYYQHYILDLNKNSRKILSIPMVNGFVSELDVHFAVNIMQNIANEIMENGNWKQYFKIMNQNSYLLNKKTLLIPHNYTAYLEDDIKQYYQGSIKIVKEQEIIDAIHSNDSNYAYLVININHISELPSFNHFIFDCATNNPLYLYMNSILYTRTGIQKRNKHILKREIQFLYILHFKKYNSKL